MDIHPQPLIMQTAIAGQEPWFDSILTWLIRDVGFTNPITPGQVYTIALFRDNAMCCSAHHPHQGNPPVWPNDGKEHWIQSAPIKMRRAIRPQR